MSPRSIAGLLADLESAAMFMSRRADGQTLKSYLLNEDLQTIFERKFEIIGEALAALRKFAPEVFAGIRHAQQAVDFRNVLIHGYASIDHELVWDTYRRWLPELVENVRGIG